MARDEPLGLELGAERLGRVGGRCPFHDLSVGEAAALSLSRASRSNDLSKGMRSPGVGMLISRRKDPAQRESLGTEEKTS